MQNRRDIIADIVNERHRQLQLWGTQHWPNGTSKTWDQLRKEVTRQTDKATKDKRLTWQLILWEEVLEVFSETNPTNLRQELVQVAAVALQWIEALDGNNDVTDSGRTD